MNPIGPSMRVLNYACIHGTAATGDAGLYRRSLALAPVVSDTAGIVGIELMTWTPIDCM